MADISSMRQKFFDTQRQNINQDVARQNQSADDVVKRRFAALGQAGSGAQIGSQLKAQNDIAENAQKANSELGGQMLQAEIQAQDTADNRNFQTGMADKDAAMKREFFGAEQGNKLKEIDLAERQFALDKDTTEFNKRMAEIEANKEKPGLLGGGGLLGSGLKFDNLGHSVESGVRGVLAVPTGGLSLPGGGPIGNLFSGGGGGTYFCTELFNRRLCGWREMFNMSKVFFAAIGPMTNTCKFYALNGPKIVAAANKNGFDWGSIKHRLIDEPCGLMDENKPIEAMNKYSQVIKDLCLSFPETRGLWSDRILKTTWLDRVIGIPILLFTKTFRRDVLIYLGGVVADLRGVKCPE